MEDPDIHDKKGAKSNHVNVSKQNKMKNDNQGGNTADGDERVVWLTIVGRVAVEQKLTV